MQAERGIPQAARGPGAPRLQGRGRAQTLALHAGGLRPSLPSDSPSVRVAVNPRGLPCTHPWLLTHSSKCSLPPLPPRLTLPAVLPGEQHWGFSPPLTVSTGPPREGSDLLRATGLLGRK